ncbi:MAG: DoxX family protein [Rikenellaceae bacterium]
MFYTVIRLLLGALFLFSGWVKAIDPAGLSYKIAEYGASFGMPWLDDVATPFATILCALELFLGLMMFFKLWQKVVSVATFLFMLFFTIITLLIMILPDVSVKECGCFGDAILLTNTQTFYKNIVILLFAFLYARHVFISSLNSNNKYYYDTGFMSRRKKCQLKFLRLVVYLYILGFSFAIPLYSIFYLPPYTYLPYDIGENIIQTGNNTSSDEVKTKLIYENIASGEKRTFDIDDTEWQDDTKWKYIDTETSGGSSNQTVGTLAIYNQEKENVTKELLGQQGYTFLVITHDINELNYHEINNLESLLKLRKGKKIELVVVTTTPIESAKMKLSTLGWGNVEVYNCDLVELKSLLRDKSGVVLIKDGIISGKWNFKGNILKNISYNDLQPLIDWERNTIIFFFIIVGLFMAVMLYLIIEYHRTRR